MNGYPHLVEDVCEHSYSEVNSYLTAGGSAVASDAIYQEVVKVQQAGKPVVVSMGNLAASGGYYISGQPLSFISHPLPGPACELTILQAN